jgi:2-isopropylmalate synthase
MAGADRVEGTLFGNGERTGNCDLTTMALNLFSQGIDPELDFTDINLIRDVWKRVNKLPIHPRHPYVGDLVYTAFSGSHQDAIRKGMDAYDAEHAQVWEVPYLPIDPQDVGRTYESIIRINSQSGKGGVAFVLEQEYGLRLPKTMHPEVGQLIQGLSEQAGKELQAAEIWQAFAKAYLDLKTPIHFLHLNEVVSHEDATEVCASLSLDGEEVEIFGEGNGPLEAFAQALAEFWGRSFELLSYDEHAVEGGVNARAAAYVQVQREDGQAVYGVGVDSNISIAAIKALVSALNRAWIEEG